MFVFNKLNRYILSNKSNFPINFEAAYYAYILVKKYTKYINHLLYGYLFELWDDETINYYIISQSNAYNITIFVRDINRNGDRDFPEGKFYLLKVYMNDKILLKMEPVITNDAQYYLEYDYNNDWKIVRKNINKILGYNEEYYKTIYQNICKQCFVDFKDKYFM